MQVDQLLAGQRTQSEVERQRRSASIFRESPGEIEVCLLEDIRRIEPAVQAAVEAQAHHLPQPVTVVGKQLGQCLRVSRQGPVDLLVAVTGVNGSDRSHI